MQQDERTQQEREDIPKAGEQPGQQGEAEPIVVVGEVVPEGEAEPIVVLDEAEQQLSEARQKAEEYLDLLRRTQADFVNYRRRMSQEQAEAGTTAQISLLNQLLPVLDDFERALSATPEDLTKHPWVQGLFLVERRLTTLLDQLGVERIGEAGDQFDPRKHEALTLEERADAPEGTILQVIRSGYTLGQRIIRPAQVIVAGAPSPVSDVSS